MDWADLFNGFQGRIGRGAFWIGIVALTVAEVAAQFVAQSFEGDRLSAIIDLAFIYPEFAVTLKRAHDRELPVWLLVVFFAGGALLDFLTVLGLTGADDTPSMVTMGLVVLYTVFGFALLIELGFRRGTVGPNRYGPDPLARV